MSHPLSKGKKRDKDRATFYYEVEDMSGYSQFSTSFPGREEEDMDFLSPGLSVLAPCENESQSLEVSSTINCLFAQSDDEAKETDKAVSVLNGVITAHEAPLSKGEKRAKGKVDKKREALIFFVGMIVVCLLAAYWGASSLVKYDTKILVSTSGKGGKGSKKIKTQPTALDKAGLSPTEDILNSILPPRESTEDGQLWVQYVSSDPATPADVVKLQEELDRRLVQRQARETGICPIREELYAQAFDELIRQVTIICTERGLLLLRVRDEIRMTIQAYQTLYESSIAFGMRKALQAEQRKSQTESNIKSLDEDCVHLQADVEALEQEIRDLEIKEKERIEKEDKEHAETMELKNRYNQTLREKLETLLSAPKK